MRDLAPHRAAPLRIGVLLTLSLALALLHPSSANASNWATGEVPYINLGAQQVYYYDNLKTYSADATTWTRNNNIDPTDMYTSKTSDHDVSHVHVIDEFYDATWLGITTCPVYAGGGRCQHWHVRYDLTDWNGWETYKRRHNACHETGHSTGLDHTTAASCMKSGAMSELYFTDHDRAHINGAY